ncbi:MAG: IS21 family transposase [Thermodesulfobacteriota bacterium]
MLTVEQKEVIRRDFFIYRKSMRQIARERHMSRKTIRKAVYDPGIPVYSRNRPAPQGSIGSFVEVIRQWLQEDKQRPAKPRHTARRIFYRLRGEHGYSGSERTVRREVSALRGAVPDSHVPQTYAPAEGGTFDFGEAMVQLGGRETKVHLGCLRLDYSSHYFVCALPSERQEALFECHLRGFVSLGGVPPRMRYDNLKPAVAKILSGRDRQEQSGWVAFRSHFLFESEYVTPGRGQEKGGVENLVGYVRRNFLVPLLEFQDYEALNTYLAACADRDARERRRFGRTVHDLWREEQANLRPLPARLPAACVFRPAKVNRRQQVRYANNWYSVPPQYVGQVVTVHAYVFRVELAWQDQVIASHSRSYGREEEILDPHHYLPVLLRKPGALARATPIRKWELPPVYEAYHRQLRNHRQGSGGTREYIRILMLLKDHPLPAVTAAVEQAAAVGVYRYEAVKGLLSGPPEPSWRHSLPPVWPNQVDHFDRLVHG